MTPDLRAYQTYWQTNRLPLIRYFAPLVVITLAVMVYLLARESYLYLSLLVAPVVLLAVITHPRVAVYQFVGFLFSNAVVSTNPVLLYVDLSACIVIWAALLDFLLDRPSPVKFPRIFLNLILLLVTVFISGVAGFNFFLAVRPLARMMLMTATFISLYRLGRHFSIRHLIELFFWVGVVNAAVALSPLAATGEIERAFGFAVKTLDDLMMITVPVGLLLYLWSARYRGIAYLLGTGVAIVALLATQSRLPMMFAAGFSLLAMLLALGATRRMPADTAPGAGYWPDGLRTSLVRRRITLVAIFAVLLAGTVAALKPGLVVAVLSRFEALLSGTTGGTVRLRLLLWQTALNAFSDNPVFGVGPGNFDVIHLIYQQLHLNPAQAQIQGLSAHNLVLHYLAETGLVGGAALIILFVNQFRLARKQYLGGLEGKDPASCSILYLLAILFLLTAFVEAAWMWGQISFIFVFFLALIVRSFDKSMSTT